MSIYIYIYRKYVKLNDYLIFVYKSKMTFKMITARVLEINNFNIKYI